MSFPRYPTYKDSGVEWLGGVPQHWEVWKLAQAFTVIANGTTPKTDQREYYDEGDVPWINTGDLNDGDLEICDRRITALALADHSSLKVYPAGSLLIAMYGATIGKLAILRFPATVNQACCVFAGASPIESKFMYFWFLGLRQQILSLATGGGQPNVSQDRTHRDARDRPEPVAWLVPGVRRASTGVRGRRAAGSRRTRAGTGPGRREVTEMSSSQCRSGR